MRPRTLATLLLACVAAPGCVFVPVVSDGWDERCQLVTHHVGLETVALAHDVNLVNVCDGPNCVAMLVVAGAGVAAASAAVSGSIAVVGNAGYEIQRRMNCVPPAPAPAPV